MRVLALLILLTACTPADTTPEDTPCTESCNLRHTTCSDSADVNETSIMAPETQTGMGGQCSSELETCLKSCPAK